MKTIQLLISGKVQGVYFRASAKKIADELGVTGWAKNLLNNQVEITATATEEILLRFIDWCKQGPPKANVNNVQIQETIFQPFKDFRIIR